MVWENSQAGGLDYWQEKRSESMGFLKRSEKGIELDGIGPDLFSTGVAKVLDDHINEFTAAAFVENRNCLVINF